MDPPEPGHPMPRFHLPSEHWSSAELTGDEAKHLAQVLRLGPGAEITVFDGMGRRAEAIVREATRKRVSLELGEVLISSPPPPHITLAQAIPKGKNMEFIVQKAVELGVARIQPLVTSNTVVQPGEGKSEKWRRIALEACKQCGQDTLPAIEDPLPFEQWATTKDHGLALVASLAPGAKSMRETLHAQRDTKSCTILVGPEGDFTPAELSTAIAGGFLPVTLGDIVLRVETAALYCLSAVRYEFG